MVPCGHVLSGEAGLDALNYSPPTEFMDTQVLITWFTVTYLQVKPQDSPNRRHDDDAKFIGFLIGFTDSAVKGWRWSSIRKRAQ